MVATIQLEEQLFSHDALSLVEKIIKEYGYCQKKAQGKMKIIPPEGEPLNAHATVYVREKPAGLAVVFAEGFPGAIIYGLYTCHMLTSGKSQG